MAIIPVYSFWQELPITAFILFIVGGISYSVGAVVYQQDKLDIIPGILGSHEIFHILTVIGAILHYIAIRIIF